jgi:hypothetical protein
MRKIYPAHVVFLDYSNASDDVDRDSFLNVYESHCISGNLINAVKWILKNMNMYVEISGRIVTKL